MNTNNQTDFFSPIFKGWRVTTLSVSITSLVVLVLAEFLTLFVIQYDLQVNRRTTLLTKLNVTAQWMFVFYGPVQLVDTIRSNMTLKLIHRIMAIKSQNFLYLRFALGNPIHPWVCQAYVYYRFVLSSSFCIILSIDAVFHYVFIKFKSNFPLIKEELVTRICIRYTRC